MKDYAKATPNIYVLEADTTARRELVGLVTSIDATTVEYDNAERFLAELDPCQPGCIVSSIGLKGDINGIELLEQLAHRRCEIPSILIARYATTQTVVRAMKHGAVTVLDTPINENELILAIREAIQTDSLIRKRRAEVSELIARFSQLTDQERTVLRLIVEGNINKQISGQLDVSVRTVESRRQQIFRKTGALNLGQLIWQAMLLRTEGYDLFSCRLT